MHTWFWWAGVRKKADLRRLTHDLGVADRVTVTGRVPTVWPYYATADTFTSASIIESFGIVYIEAMASGLPIVATAVPGAEEVLNLATRGVTLVTPEDTDSFAKAFEKVHADRPRPVYENALQRFDIGNSIDEHLRLYEQLSE